MHRLRTIRNCTIRPKAKCPKRWDDLTPTDSPTTRHCPKCDHAVHFCATDEETLAHARAGHCVARQEADRTGMPMVIGRAIGPLPDDTERLCRSVAGDRREHGIDMLLKGGLDSPSRPCPNCIYPVPNFRKSCYVCGTILGRA